MHKFFVALRRMIILSRVEPILKRLLHWFAYAAAHMASSMTTLPTNCVLASRLKAIKKAVDLSLMGVVVPNGVDTSVSPTKIDINVVV